VTEGRVHRDTRRTFVCLLIVSVAIHVLLTPVAGMFSFLQDWLDRPKPEENSPAEQLKEIPIELFEAPDEVIAPKDVLPKEDPVALIEQLDQLPVRSESKPPVKPEAAASKPSAPDDKDPKARKNEPADAGVGHTHDPASDSTSDVPAPSAEASTSSPQTASDPPSSDGPEEVARVKPDVAIDNPVALAGKAAKLVEKNTSVGVVLYMDRIRGHVLGKRVGEVLPALPQWRDFFGSSNVNPVRDFDRMFLLGPSFVDSSGLVMAIDHRVAPDKMRGAINELVKKRGRWLTGTKVPVAFTYADNAERVILLSSARSVMVIPPHLQTQALNQGETHIPNAKGEEAVVASITNPSKALRRFGLEVPASLKLAKLRVTPLAKGEVLLELDAQDESEVTARQTAAELTRTINATLDMISSVSGILGRFGFGALAGGAELPRVKLRADGKWVRSSQVLTEAQVAFILDRLERQLVRRKVQPAPSGSSNQRPPAP
jgi:hypothetical protein